MTFETFFHYSFNVLDIIYDVCSERELATIPAGIPGLMEERVMRFFTAFLILFVAPAIWAQQSIFKTTTPLPEPRQMYGAAVVGDYLYVIGGNMKPDIYTDTVIMSKINPDGSIGKWKPTTRLPEPRCYINNTTLVLNGRIYVVGGLNGTSMEKTQTVLWSEPGSDGHLGKWTESVACPGAGVSCAAAVATPGEIHLLGGSLGGNEPVSSVWSATVQPNGQIFGWRPGPPLPVPLWFHNCGLADGKVWVWSGLTGAGPKTANPNIYYSSVDQEGSLSNWKMSEKRLEEPFYSASCTVCGDYLLSFCPRYKSANYTGDIYYSVVRTEGLSDWVKMPCSLPTKLYHGVTTSFKHGVVYLPGGRKSREELIFDQNVYYFHLIMRKGGETSERQELDKLKFFEDFKTAGQIYDRKKLPVFLYFYDPYDQASREQIDMMDEQLLKSCRKKIILAKVNIAKNKDIAENYHIESAPSWLFYDTEGNLHTTLKRKINPQELSRAVRFFTKP